MGAEECRHTFRVSVFGVVRTYISKMEKGLAAPMGCLRRVQVAGISRGNRHNRLFAATDASTGDFTG
jgi:hypothetical protein